MAKIEDLIAQIPDERLKKAIVAEVRELKKNKKFGLVFEEHLPETVRLPKMPVKDGDLVAKKRDAENELWRVKSIRKGIATLEKAIEGYPRPSEVGIQVPLAELVVVRSFGDPIYPALVPVDRIERGGPDKPWHMLINADNFHALQLLSYTHTHKVDCIYIDPPYNTGARDWKYNNDYVDETDQFRHSKWLAMMERRLRLAKRLLNPASSVLIVTIDEKEYLRLGLLLEQVFPGANIQMVSITISPRSTSRANEFSRVDEYAFFVFIGAVQIGSGERSGNDGEVRWLYLRRTQRSLVRGSRPRQFYPVFVNRSTKKIVHIGAPLSMDDKIEDVPDVDGATAIYPIAPDGTALIWGLTGPSLKRALDAGFVRVTDGNEHQPYTIAYLSTEDIKRVERGEYIVSGTRPDGSKIVVIPGGKATRPSTVWRESRHDAGAYGTSLLGQMIPGRKFSFPKSLYAVEDAIRLFLDNKPSAVVVDFFSGSGTTAHALMRLNKQDGGIRQSISVTNNEVGVDEQRVLLEQGLQPGDAAWERRGICEHVTMPRLRAAITGKTPEGQFIQGDYKFTDEFPMADGFEENLEYFRLDFLDPDEVARGEAFKAILPILWMVAGCRGEREDSKGSTPWFIPKHSPFAILIQEKQFRAFREKLAERKDIEWVFLITDSEENFSQMRRTLGRKYECHQLYKSYLENFRINTQDALRG